MTDSTSAASKPACTFRRLFEEGSLDAGHLYELFAHLAVGCSECLPRVPPALLHALGFSEGNRYTGLFSGRGGTLVPCRLTHEEMDRWFAHRLRAEPPEALEAILALPPGARLYRLLTDEAMRAPEAVKALGACLDSLVLTRPRDAAAIAQAGLVFATASPPEALPRPIGEDLHVRALRASLEVALRWRDDIATEHYAGWLVRLWDTCADPYEVAEIAGTYALLEVRRGAFANAVSRLIEGATTIEKAGDCRFSGHLLTNAATVALLDERLIPAEMLASVALEKLAAAGAEEALVENARRVLSRALEPEMGTETSAQEAAARALERVSPLTETAQ